MQLFEDCGIVISSSAEEVAKQADTVILAVKPQILPSVLPALSPILARRTPLVISIAAGKSISWIEELLGGGVPLVRVMPNIAARVGEGMAAFCANGHVTDTHKKTVRMIFEAVGQIIELTSIFSRLYLHCGLFARLYTYVYRLLGAGRCEVRYPEIGRPENCRPIGARHHPSYAGNGRAPAQACRSGLLSGRYNNRGSLRAPGARF